MPQPYNYALNVQDPSQAVLSGLQAGYGIQEAQQQRAEREAKLAQAQAQQQQAAAMQDDLYELSKNPTVSGTISAMIKYPQLSEQLKRPLDALTPQEKQATLSEASQVYAALQSGNPEVAIDYLNKQSAAHANSGDENRAKILNDMANLIEISPETAKTTTGLFLASAMGADKYTEAFSALEKEQREKQLQPGAIEKQAAEIRKMASDAGLSDAKANESAVMARKLGAEAAKTLIEMEQLSKTGGIDPEKKFDFEDKLRRQYVDRTKGLPASRDAFLKVQASANDGTGPGDIALVTSFMKMLDPGSVVRETEFATARDTTGLLTQLHNMADKYTGGSFLSDKQRKDFTRLAKQYMDAALTQEKSVRNSLMKPVQSYGLNADNVFGEQQEQQAEQPSQAPAQAGQVKFLGFE